MSEEDKAKKLENLLKLLQLNNGDTSKFTQEQKKAMKTTNSGDATGQRFR